MSKARKQEKKITCPSGFASRVFGVSKAAYIELSPPSPSDEQNHGVDEGNIRKNMIAKVQQFLDTNPDKGIMAASIVNILEDFKNQP